jgi:hypothetical protein
MTLHPVPRNVPDVVASEDTVLAGWTRAWTGVVVLAVVNGGIHRAYEQPLGELRAHQLSGVTLLLLLAPWAARTQRRHPLTTARAAVEAGAVWAGCTVAFEFLFFHYVGGQSWAQLLHDYDLTQGRIWGLVVCGIALAPALARAASFRRRGSRSDRS